MHGLCVTEEGAAAMKCLPSPLLCAVDGRAVLPWQPGDMMITYSLDHARITVRASGTEPKCKWYSEAYGQEGARSLADRLEAAVAAELVQPEAHGLTRPTLTAA